MLPRILKVVAYMFPRIFAYGWIRAARPREAEAWLARQFAGWTGCVLEAFEVDLSIEGSEHLAGVAGDRKLIIMSNHQSQLDIPCLGRAAGRVIGFVAKRELSRVPILNFWMRQIGCVFIDRSDKRGAHEALAAAARQMTAKPLVVFPEGTRSKEGKLLPFKLGGTRLALLARAVIVPVRIEGTRDAMEKRAPGAGLVRVRLRAFPPLDAADLDEGKASQIRIKDYVERCWHGGSVPS